MMTQSKRPRIYLDVNPDFIPDELAALDRWVNWKPVWDKQHQRWDKPPVDGKTDRRIDCTKASNVKSLAQVLEAKQQAWEACQKARELPPEERPFVPLYGIGFSLAKHLPGLEKLKGIDLDHCIQPTGEIDQWAREILEALRTYTEISPSGDGFHLLVKGDLPDGYKHKITGLGPEKRGALEVYEEGRYLTITGDAELRG
jgi:putative DNA primase/helicase